MKPTRIVVDPRDPGEALRQLAHSYDLDADTVEFLRRIVALYSRPVLLQVNQSGALFYSHTPLVDKFTFNMQSDELVLFTSDPLTFIDAMLEMAMYQAGFSTMIGVDDGWKIEFAIGAWKPVKNRLKRELGIPVIDEPLWVVGLPPEPEEVTPDDPHPFLTLVAQLDIASFTQMVRLAARDDVEVSFPEGSDPRVIQVYLRMKSAIDQVANGLSLEDWREFNHRLLAMVTSLDDEFTPADLPEPAWWRQADTTEEIDEHEEWIRRANEDSVESFCADQLDVQPEDRPPAADSAAEPDDPPDSEPQADSADAKPDDSSEPWVTISLDWLTRGPALPPEGLRRYLESLADSGQKDTDWNPFESYLDELLGDDDEPL